MKGKRQWKPLVLGFVLAISLFGGCSENPSASEGEVVFEWISSSYELEEGETTEVLFELSRGGQDLSREDVIFQSSDPEVMTAAEGKITGVSEGSAVLTVSWGERSLDADVTVLASSRRLESDLGKAELVLGISSMESVAAEFHAFSEDQEVPDAEIVYSVADPAVARADASGRITALAKGETTLTAAWNGIRAEIPVVVWKTADEEEIASLREPYVNRFGRMYFQGDELVADNPATGVELAFYGTAFRAEMSASANIYFRAYIDGDREGVFTRMNTGKQTYTLAEGLPEGVHTVRIVKSSELDDGALRFCSFETEQFLEAPEKSGLKIEFVGDSLTTGYGVLEAGTRTIDNSDVCKGYAYLTAQALNADYSCVALQGICVKAHMWQSSVNMWDMYGCVSLVTREPYIAESDPDVIVVNLGTNEHTYIAQKDPSYAEVFPDDYYDFLSYLRKTHKNSYIVCLYGMQAINQSVNDGIREAVDRMKDEKVLCFNKFVADSSGANGHPGVRAQAEYARRLTAYLSTIV